MSLHINSLINHHHIAAVYLYYLLYSSYLSLSQCYELCSHAQPYDPTTPVDISEQHPCRYSYIRVAKKSVALAVTSRIASDVGRTVMTSPTASHLYPDLVFVLERYRKLLTSCLHLRIFLQYSESCCIIRDILILLFVLRNSDIGLLHVRFGGVVKICLIPLPVVLPFLSSCNNLFTSCV